MSGNGASAAGDVLSLFTGLFGKVSAFEENKRVGLLQMSEAARAASIADRNAALEREQGSMAAGWARIKGTRAAQQQRVAFASAGIDTNSGTAMQLQESTAAMAELDAVTIRNNARRAAFGHEEVARRARLEEGELRRKWRDGGLLGGTADDALALDLVSTAFGGVLSATGNGMGGK